MNRKKKRVKRYPGRVKGAKKIAAFAMLMLTCAVPQASADVFRFQPSVTLTEMYDDNVFLQQGGKKGSFITVAAPSLSLVYTTTFWDWNIAYTYYYFYYTKHGIEDDSTHALALKNRTELLKDRVFLELQDDYTRVSRDVAINYARQSPLVNQADQNVLTIHPYARIKPWEAGGLILGYTYQDTRFFNETVTTPALGANVDHFDHIISVDLGHNLSSRITVTATGRYTHEDNTEQDFDQKDAYAGFSYRFAEHSSLSARGGKSWFEFAHDRLSPEFWIWDANLSHRIAWLTFGVATSRSVVQDPIRVVTRGDAYAASIMYGGERASLTLTGSLNQYRDMLLNMPIADSEAVSLSLLYRLTQRMTCTAGAGFQDVENKLDAMNRPVETNTRLILSNFRLSYQLAPKTSLAGEYRYVHSDSTDPLTGTYYSNQYLIEFKHTF